MGKGGIFLVVDKVGYVRGIMDGVGERSVASFLFNLFVTEAPTFQGRPGTKERCRQPPPILPIDTIFCPQFTNYMCVSTYIHLAKLSCIPPIKLLEHGSWDSCFSNTQKWANIQTRANTQTLTRTPTQTDTLKCRATSLARMHRNWTAKYLRQPPT